MRRLDGGIDCVGWGGDAPQRGGNTRDPAQWRRVEETRRTLVRPLRAWLVTTHSGGSGTPPVRHYDRSARSSLKWDRDKQSPRPRKRGPELRRIPSARNAACGAP